MMGGQEILISDEEAEKIMDVAENTKFIQTRGGNFVNLASVSCIVNYEGVELFENKKVFKSSNGEKYITKEDRDRGGTKRVYLTSREELNLEYRTLEQQDNFIGETKERLRLETEDSNKRKAEVEAKLLEKREKFEKEKKRLASLSEEEQLKETLEKKKELLEGFEKRLESGKSSYLTFPIVTLKKEIKELENKLITNKTK